MSALVISRRLQVMGVINTTPDSFSDGGALYAGGALDIDLALGRAAQMVAEGAAILDIQQRGKQGTFEQTHVELRNRVGFGGFVTAINEIPLSVEIQAKRTAMRRARRS